MICYKCNQEKELYDFNFRNKEKGLRSSKCRKCTAIYRKQYYFENRIKGIEHSKKTTKAIRLRNRQFIWDYLKFNPCVTCSNSDPVVLGFDHKDSVEKLGDLSTLSNRCWSLEKLKKEIEKCEVMCANCHLKRTAVQFNWYKSVIK